MIQHQLKSSKMFLILSLGLLMGGLSSCKLGTEMKAKLALKYVSLTKRKAGPNKPVIWERGESQNRKGKPNIVFILFDDVGFNDLSVYGKGIIKTPHIDKLAKEGALFTQSYSGSATCAPSRSMLMTGRYPSKTGFEFTPTPDGMAKIVRDLTMVSNPDRPVGEIDTAAMEDLPPFRDQGLPTEEITIAELLQDRGYHTVHIGKWHLGRSSEMRPTAQGFNESLLMASGLYLPEKSPEVVNAKLDFDPIDRFLWASQSYAVSRDGGDNWFKPKGYLTDYFTNEATKVIEANSNRPFFLYLAHWGTHTPLQAKKEDYDSFPNIQPHRKRVYASMIKSLDRSVGKIMAKLEEEGLADNTMVVITSDNGGAGYLGIPETNAPLRGFKITFFEGGIRVPTLMRWPGNIPGNTKIKTPINHIDFFPTFAAATKTELPEGVEIDGVNLLPLFKNYGTKFERAQDAIFWSSGTYKVVRVGDWKLQVDERQDKTWLFNLKEDPREKNNLAKIKSEKVSELTTLMEDHFSEAVPPIYPSTVVMPVAVDKTLAEPFKKGDIYIKWPN